jgi:hypothetical protein
MRDGHRRFAGGRHAFGVGGFEAGIGHCVECGVRTQLDLRHVRDDAEGSRHLSAPVLRDVAFKDT